MNLRQTRGGYGVLSERDGLVWILKSVEGSSVLLLGSAKKPRALQSGLSSISTESHFLLGTDFQIHTLRCSRQQDKVSGENGAKQHCSYASQFLLPALQTTQVGRTERGAPLNVSLSQIGILIQDQVFSSCCFPIHQLGT